jgi:hypothetical protein
MMHGHAHVVLGRDRHYAKVEALRSAALRYRETYGADYFNDLFEVYSALGLGFEKDAVRVYASLTRQGEGNCHPCKGD